MLRYKKIQNKKTTRKKKMSSNDLPKQCYYPNHCIQSYVENIKGLCHLVCNQVDKPNHSWAPVVPLEPVPKESASENIAQAGCVLFNNTVYGNNCMSFDN